MAETAPESVLLECRLSARVVSLRAFNGCMAKTARQAEAEAARATAGQARLQAQLSASQHDNDELRRSVAELTAAAAAYRTELEAAHHARIADAASALRRELQLREQLSASQRDISVLRNSAAELTADAAAVRTELAAVQDARTTDAAAAAERETPLGDQLRATQQDNDKLCRSVGKLTTEVASGHAELVAAGVARANDAAAAAEREALLQDQMTALAARIAAVLEGEARLQADLDKQTAGAAAASERADQLAAKVAGGHCTLDTSFPVWVIPSVCSTPST